MRRKDDEKRKSIKQAVVRVILEEGLHGASIAKIAKAAGVSPATVYIYYENKEEMLRDIYHEYAEDVFRMLLEQIDDDLPGPQLIDILVRHYYHYIREYEDIFHFVEQYDFCPALNNGCSPLNGPEKLNKILIEYKKKGVLNNYSNNNIWAMLFYPVKALVKNSPSKADELRHLDEMVMILQKALLK